jgi:hypothetical protein
MQNDDWILPSEAARILNLNRSTISRQISKGAICTRADGMVRLVDVIRSRADNLYPQRVAAAAERKKGK